MAGDYFELEARGTNVRTEIVAGVTTFLTMSYIIFVQPEMLSEAGMDKTALIAVTCITSGLVTLVTGLVANAPIAMVRGMGLNAFFVRNKVPDTFFDLIRRMLWTSYMRTRRRGVARGFSRGRGIKRR